ncbi:hypothetical protein [Streptomyces roseoviridis]|uniref:Uncharacterized protein n=1 Tax=Streptomyces roseoviridis TaxID=67361 RepID=A0ABV5QP67_9ACTN
MDALQGHLLDSYRAAGLGEPAPPAPGTHDPAVLREVLRAVLARMRGRLGAGPG